MLRHILRSPGPPRSPERSGLACPQLSHTAANSHMGPWERPLVRNIINPAHDSNSVQLGALILFVSIVPRKVCRTFLF